MTVFRPRHDIQKGMETIGCFQLRKKYTLHPYTQKKYLSATDKLVPTLTRKRGDNTATITGCHNLENDFLPPPRAANTEHVRGVTLGIFCAFARNPSLGTTTRVIEGIFEFSISVLGGGEAVFHHLGLQMEIPKSPR